MKTKTLFSLLIALLLILPAQAQKRLLFDLSHGQCQGSSYLGDVVPDYRRMAADNGAEFIINEQPLTAATLKGIDVVLMLSPLQHDLQKNITAEEAEALVKFIKRGGALLVFVDEESHRVHLDKYNINAVTKPFGVEFGGDNKIVVPLQGFQSLHDAVNYLQLVESQLGDNILDTIVYVFRHMASAKVKRSVCHADEVCL